MPEKAYKGVRKVYHREQWQEFSIWEMDLLSAGNQVEGPAIIEHPMTTLVIPPGKRVVLDEHKVIWYK